MAAKVLIVKVTQEHIDKGERKSPQSCPIALASDASAVTRKWMCVNYSFYELSRAAERFVRRFDAGQPVTPATFRLKKEYEEA